MKQLGSVYRTCAYRERERERRQERERERERAREREREREREIFRGRASPSALSLNRGNPREAISLRRAQSWSVRDIPRFEISTGLFRGRIVVLPERDRERG